MSQGNNEGYYIEFYALGNSVKVTAIDPHTGLEATIVAPANANKEYMKQQAAAKLERKLKRLAKDAPADPDDDPTYV